MHRGLKITAWVVGTLLGLWFLLAGAQKFLARQLFEEMFAEFGLPTWAVPVIGVAELAGAVLVVIPRTSVYGAATIAVVMAGALTCHLATGVGSPVASAIALVLAIVVGAIRLR